MWLNLPQKLAGVRALEHSVIRAFWEQVLNNLSLFLTPDETRECLIVGISALLYFFIVNWDRPFSENNLYLVWKLPNDVSLQVSLKELNFSPENKVGNRKFLVLKSCFIFSLYSCTDIHRCEHTPRSRKQLSERMCTYRNAEFCIFLVSYLSELKFCH